MTDKEIKMIQEADDLNKIAIHDEKQKQISDEDEPLIEDEDDYQKRINREQDLFFATEIDQED